MTSSLDGVGDGWPRPGINRELTVQISGHWTHRGPFLLRNRVLLAATLKAALVCLNHLGTYGYAALSLVPTEDWSGGGPVPNRTYILLNLLGLSQNRPFRRAHRLT